MTAKSRRRKAARTPRKSLGPWDGTSARPSPKAAPKPRNEAPSTGNDDTSQE